MHPERSGKWGLVVGSSGYQKMDSENFSEASRPGPRLNLITLGLFSLIGSQGPILANELRDARTLGERGIAIESSFPGENRSMRDAGGIGDFNGDGFSDIAVSYKIAEEADLERWAVSIIYGNPGSGGARGLLGDVPGLTTFQFRDQYVRPYADEIGHVGDLNGDGLDDLMIGYPRTTFRLDPGHGGGVAFLVHGSRGMAGDFFLEDIGSTVPGTVFFSSNHEDDGIGERITTVGDFNDDGETDLAITAPFSGVEDRLNSGAVFVLLGARDLPIFVDLNEVGKSLPGFVILGDPKYRQPLQRFFGEMLGQGLSPVGDFNADGFDDFSITALEGGSTAYLIYGRKSPPATLDLTGVSGQGGIDGVSIFLGVRSDDQAVGVGDVNGDGFGDVLLGVTKSIDTFNRITLSYLIYGREDFPKLLALEELYANSSKYGISFRPHQGGFISSTDEFGASLAPAGDLNGDGIPDFLIGARGAQIRGRARVGEAYAIFGKRRFEQPAILLDQSFDGIRILGEELNNSFGAVVGPAGDFNGDGIPDIAILAPILGNTAQVPEAARAYVIFGPGNGEAPFSIDRVLPRWGPVRGNTQVTIEGSGFTNDVQVFFGGLRAGGIQIASESRLEAFTPAAEKEGAVEVRAVRGPVSSSLALAFEYNPDFPEIDLANLQANGVVLAQEFDEKLSDVSLDTGDITGDGIADLIMGWRSPLMRDSFKTAWMVTIVKGGPGLPAQISPMERSERVVLITTSDVDQENRGCTVAVIGDVDGDGVVDLGIGARKGIGYVVFGGDHLLAETNIEDLVESGAATRFDRGFLGQGLNTPYTLDFAPVGDLTGDGIAEFAIGFPGAPMRLGDSLPGGSDLQPGEILILEGAVRGEWGDEVDLRNPGLGQKRIHGATPVDGLGGDLIPAGDVNGDGHMDLLTVRAADPEGRVYLLYGRRWDQLTDDDPADNYMAAGGGITLTMADGRNLSSHGVHLASAGDANGDGFADILLGVETGGIVHTAFQGVSYLIPGGPDLPGDLTLVENPPAPDGIVRIFGELSMIHTARVGPAGDFNSDGFDDLLIAASGSITSAGTGPASFYVVFGKAAFPGRIDLENLAGKGIKIDGNGPNPFINRLKHAGDLNGDGRDDLAMTQVGGIYDLQDPNTFRPGKVFIVFGYSGPSTFRRGDPNVDGRVDMSDAVFILEYLFLGKVRPACEESADVDDSGAIDVSDPIYLLHYQFLGGPAPAEPLSKCGGDTSPDRLTCDAFAPCQR